MALNMATQFNNLTEGHFAELIVPLIIGAQKHLKMPSRAMELVLINLERFETASHQIEYANELTMAGAESAARGGGCP